MKWWRKIRVFFIKTYRILRSSAKAFIDNNDSLKASALTFYTLISIVPFLAVAFGIAKGFGFEQYLETEFSHLFKEQEEALSYAMRFAKSLLQNAKGSVIAGVGLVALLWSNLSMLNNIENALNDIWRVKQPRTYAKKITDYLAAMIICPIVLVVSSSLSVFLATQITEGAKEYAIVEVISPYLTFLLNLTPYILSTLLFIVIYLFIPNVRGRVSPRIWGGILAGIAFQLWQWIYIKFQVGISNYGAIYGTFAALPLFLIWVQVSWIIVLIGAELAAHIENEMSYAEFDNPEQVREISSKELGLLILYMCIRAFSKGEPPPTALDMSKNLGISLMMAQKMIGILEEGELIVEVMQNDESQLGYQPRKDARLFTLKGVCDAIERQLGWNVSVENSQALQQISECLQELDTVSENAPSNITLDKL